MLFNSIDFAFFLPAVFFLYWFVAHRSIAIQNTLIVAASYVFYGWWDWRFLTLILFSTTIDYVIGLRLAVTQGHRGRTFLLWCSIAVNIGLLGFFKYYNFFVDNFAQAFSLFGTEMQVASLHIILPVGISFYTFQTLSYTIDVYRRQLEPTKDFMAFAAFVSFFPQLVAGPIERATNLLPQFIARRQFDYSKAVDGLRQILWGLFKKIVIADNCAVYVNMIFSNSNEYSGSTLLLGAVFFVFQVYGDFSGYSDIAIGTSRLFGLNLMRNFAYPYFSRDIAEFWRRWHISLSTWFRDYLYIPLGGSRGGTWSRVRNTFIIFIVCGFWHGADWTYVVWGALNAVFFLPLLLTSKNRENLEIVAKGKRLPSLKDSVSMFTTFTFIVLSLIVFRAENMDHAITYLGEVFSASLMTLPHFNGMTKALLVLILIFVFMVLEWFGREQQYAIQYMGHRRSRATRWGLYMVIVASIFLFSGRMQEFIYFQF